MHTEGFALIIAGSFVFLAIIISLSQILGHIRNYTQPNLQKYIIRIHWMVPIYGVCSWVALAEHPAGIYLTTVRSLYEAYVIYSFFCYLVECVECNLVEQSIEQALEAKGSVPQVFPFCFLADWKTGSFLKICKGGVVLYVAAHAMTTILAFVFAHTGIYGEGQYSPTAAYLYLSVVNNFVQLWAMYCLIQFYSAFSEELAVHNPVPKFLCVKFVVFFAWWQSVIITILVSVKVIQSTRHLPVDNVKTGLQEFLICIEMFIAAAAHRYAFSYHDFEDGSVTQHSCTWMLTLIVDLSLIHI
eukprot:TRINITY_DN5265_c0_g1_i3.p1 TRINITY_DN5265_c0_g1~~TRINITY_DN5265_c0_g1_i3.p1  ORF type:complete len:300 (-),score=77.94 TRINITY_DN5265_c0_g1_i3:116-1015(-)